MAAKIAFVTYETPFAPCGGVTAVMNYLPRTMQAVTGKPTLVITPFHFRMTRTVEAERAMRTIGRVKIPYGESTISVQILLLENNGQWIFLKVLDSPRGETPFFAGHRHPYDVAQSQEQPGSLLTRDALLFGSAAARALAFADPDASWTILMQDWEAATIALVLLGSEINFNYSLFLTLHNSYDAGATPDQLRAFGIRPEACPGDTVLSRALPGIQETVFTVSGQFALELTHEVIHARILAPHLARLLGSRLVGVNNGAFGTLAVEAEIIKNAQQGNQAQFLEWKEARKHAALAALDSFAATPERPFWGDMRKFGRDQAPWLIFAGRDDSRQKGYDVACKAIYNFLENGGSARFLFFPIPGDEGLEGLHFLFNLARRFPEHVIVIPGLFKEGFSAALQGSTFGVMPSFYEPFGMANEFYLNGTAGIGRATGGIIQQIVPLRHVRSFRSSAQKRADLWHLVSSAPTGLLFREADHFTSRLIDWRAINLTDYRVGGRFPDRVQAREKLALFQAMARGLETALEDAVAIYHRPQLYARMVADGIEHIQSHFTWEQAAEEYGNRLFR